MDTATGEREDFDPPAMVFRQALEETADALEGRLLEFGQMARIGRLLASSSRLEEVAARGLEILLDATPAENGSIMLHADESGSLSMLAAGTRAGRMTYYGTDGHPLNLFPDGESLASACIRHAVPIVAPDAASEPRFKARATNVEIGSIACLPLCVNGNTLGVINLSHPRAGALQPEQLGVWAVIAGYLAVALSNALLLLRLQKSNDVLQAEVDARTRSLLDANEKLKSAQEKIARNNEELKQKVEERSKALSQTLEALRNRTDSLEHANRVKDEFLNNINHELKTPLNAIIGYSGLILREATDGLSQEQRADLEVIESNGKHLQQIIDNILALKEIEGGNVNPEYLRTELPQLLKMAVTSVVPRARAKGITVVCGPLAEELGAFLMDPTLIRRVVYNLLDNAIKFSNRGTITVSATLTPENQQGGREVRIEVRDEGRGIKPEFAELIFQKFHQVEPAMRKFEGGSGVGLTIARTLVELHGGALTYEPSTGGGSVFSFLLPVRT